MALGNKRDEATLPRITFCDFVQQGICPVRRQRDGSVLKNYWAAPKDCKACPKKSQCVPNTKCKMIIRTIYDEQYLRAYARQHSEQGKRMKVLRQSTVEPVFGSLTQFYGLRNISVLGKAGAHKVMLMAAIAFNLKKYLKKEGGKPSIGIFKTIMDALEGWLTIFSSISNQDRFP